MTFKAIKGYFIDERYSLWLRLARNVKSTCSLTNLVATVRWQLKLVHNVTPDATKLFCLCRVCFGGLNWIPDNTRLSPTEKSWSINMIRAIFQFTPDTAQTGPTCRVWCGGVNWVGPTAGQVRSASECVGRRSATAGRTPTPYTLVGPTRFTPPGTTQTGPSCRVWRTVWIGH